MLGLYLLDHLLSKRIPFRTALYGSKTLSTQPGILPQQSLRTLQLLKDTRQSGVTSLQILNALPPDTVTLPHLRAVISNVASDKIPPSLYLVSGVGSSKQVNPTWLSCMHSFERCLQIKTTLSVEQDLSVLRDLAITLNTLLGEGIDTASPALVSTFKLAVKYADRAGTSRDALSLVSQHRGPALISQTLLAILDLLKYHHSFKGKELNQLALHPFVLHTLEVISLSLSVQNLAIEWAGFREGPRTLFTACAALKKLHSLRHSLSSPLLLCSGYWEKILNDIGPLALICIKGEMNRLDSLREKERGSFIDLPEANPPLSHKWSKDAKLHEGVADLLREEGLMHNENYSKFMPVELEMAAPGKTGEQYRSTLHSLRALRAAVELCVVCYPDAKISPATLFKPHLDLLSSSSDPLVQGFLSAGNCLSLSDLASCHPAAVDASKFSQTLHAAMNDFPPGAWTPKSLIDTICAHSAAPSGSVPVGAAIQLNNAALKMLAKGASGKSGVLFTPKGLVEILDGFMRMGVRTPLLAQACVRHYTSSAYLHTAFPPALLAAFFSALVGHGVRIPASLGAVLCGAVPPNEIVGKGEGIPTIAIDILHALALSGLAGEEKTGTWMGSVMHSVLTLASEQVKALPDKQLYEDNPRAAVRLRTVLETFDNLISLRKEGGQLRNYKELNLDRKVLLSLSWTNSLPPWGRLSPHEDWSKEVFAIAQREGIQKFDTLSPPLPYFQRLEVELSQAVVKAAACVPGTRVDLLASNGEMAFYSPTVAVSGESLGGRDKEKRYWMIIFTVLPPPAFVKTALDDLTKAPMLSFLSVKEAVGVSSELTLLASQRLGLLRALWKGLIRERDTDDDRGLHIVKVPFTLWKSGGGALLQLVEGALKRVQL